MKRIILAILSVTALTLLPGCGRIGDVRIGGCRLESVSPSGLRSIEAVIGTEIENHGRAFSVSDIKGRLYYKGDAVADFEADPIEVARKASGLHSLTMSATLAKGISVFGIMGMAGSFDPGLVTVDIEAQLGSGAIRRRFRQEGIPLDKIMTAAGKAARKQTL